jgi:probable HAF family extracellular repeat protein
MRDIGTLGGASAVPGANCDGQPRGFVVGASFVNDQPNANTGVPTVEPFLWFDGVMAGLGTLGGTIGSAQCSNSRGEIIGMSNLAGDTSSHAFLWRSGHMRDLGTLGGPNSEAIWINEHGMIAGSADLPGKNLHDAVIWIDGKIEDLGTVDGDACSRAYGLNAWGQEVGLSSDCVNALHAVLWDGEGPLVDLNNLVAPGSGWQLTKAFNINNRGEILAKAAPVGFTPNDDEDLGHLVLLVPCRWGDDACATTADPAPPMPSNLSARTLGAGERDLGPHNSVQENVAAWHDRFARKFNVPTRAQ